MTEGNFVDYIKMYVCSGNGGKGSVHLHREKYITKGGPDGGDGGRGGHIILKGNQNLWTLHHLKFKKHFRAGHGGHDHEQQPHERVVDHQPRAECEQRGGEADGWHHDG